jgi:hypothetical protein
MQKLMFIIFSVSCSAVCLLPWLDNIYHKTMIIGIMAFSRCAGFTIADTLIQTFYR